MQFFPIFQELLESDSVIFFLLGLVVSLVWGIFVSGNAARIGGAVAGLAVYLLCEGLIHVSENHMIGLLMLFAGTVALGCFAGFLFTLFIAKLFGRGRRR